MEDDGGEVTDENNDHDDNDSTQVGLAPKGTSHDDTSCYYY
jgi:hypothetical protein